MEGEAEGTPLFAIFVISLLSLFLVPYTIYKLCSAAGEDDAVKPWEAGERKKSSLGRFLGKLRNPSTLVTVVGWVLLIGLLIYVQQYAKELAPFDPFDILKVERSASEQDIKKAYRRLSLQYHPDKNPDPEAVPVYLQISQAYRALTDEEARKNWEKYGHPDGKQAMDMGIALPSWVMGGGGNGPLILAALVSLGVILPLGLAAWFLFSSSKYMGPNQIMSETLDIFVRSKFSVKEGQSLARIPDTLVYAYEFITMPVPPEQQGALDYLRKEILRNHPELKEKNQWFKRRTSIVKAHMLLLAHMERVEIPKVLQKDLDFVLAKSVILLEEMVKIANIPRYLPYGWLTPTLGAVEMLQSLTQAVSIGSRKTSTHGKAGGDNQAAMLQLPHVTLEVVKKMSRRKVRNLSDLLELPQEERLQALRTSGLTEGEASQTVTSLLSMPSLTVSEAVVSVDGEDENSDVLEEDIVTCSVHVVLQRRQQASTAPKGKSVLAYAPHCPVPREERWFVVLADASKNVALSWNSVSLLEAEAAGIALSKKEEVVKTGNSAASASQIGLNGHKEQNGEKVPQENPQGQLLELKFRAPPQGKYDLSLYIISDCWLGCDRILPLKLKVNELTRAEREGRTHRGKIVPVDKEESDRSENEDSNTDNSNSEEEEDYDSEESSDEESGSEAESDDADSQTSSTAPLIK